MHSLQKRQAVQFRPLRVDASKSTEAYGMTRGSNVNMSSRESPARELSKCCAWSATSLVAAAFMPQLMYCRQPEEMQVSRQPAVSLASNHSAHGNLAATVPMRIAHWHSFVCCRHLHCSTTDSVKRECLCAAGPVSRFATSNKGHQIPFCFVAK